MNSERRITPPPTRERNTLPAMPLSGEAPRQRPRSGFLGSGVPLTLVQRLGASLTLLAALVVGASLLSLWFTTTVKTNIDSIGQVSDQSIRLSELQRAWLGVVGILDTLSVTRSADESRAGTNSAQQMQDQLEDLNRRLADLEASAPGLTAERRTENLVIVKNMRDIGAQVSQLVLELYDLVEQGRWGTALQRRQTRLAQLQIDLDQNLRALNNNLQADLTDQNAAVQRLQALALLYTFLIIAAALALAAGTAWLTRRSILRPLERLNADVQRIALSTSARDLTGIQPLPQKDELGDLSRAFVVMADRLSQSYQALETRVTERTAELERRTVQVQVAAQVARDIAATRNLEDLLNRAVNLIRDRFGFYHAGIFLTERAAFADRQQDSGASVSSEGAFAVLRAATGEAGREMLARRHRLQVGQTGLVGYAAQAGRARVALDVGQDAIHFKNPLLPETRSEAALPLKIGDQVIGVLDVQSRQPQAFDEESIAILQVMADQLAIAIQNARLLAEVQQNLTELETAYGRYDRQAWETLLVTGRATGFEFDGLEVAGIQQPAAIQPLSAGSAPTNSSQPEKTQPLLVPLRVRGQQVGMLEVWPRDGEFSEAEVFLLATLSSRLSQILESARLFEEAQARAAREELINRLATGIAATLDADGVLQAAARQFSRLPGVASAAVVLAPGGTTAPASAHDFSQEFVGSTTISEASAPTPGPSLKGGEEGVGEPGAGKPGGDNGNHA